MKRIPSTNPKPPQDDPRIDALIRDYARLSEQVDTLTKIVEEQRHQPYEQQEDLTVDSILAELRWSEEQKVYPLAPVSWESAPSEQPPAEEKFSQKHLVPEKQRRKSRAWKIVGNAAFYGALVLLIVAALLIRAASDGAPTSLAGYTGMIVLSESMQSEIPKGSLVITKIVDPKTLQVGDDITYMANRTTSVTHRIIGITENYQGTGERAFELQGIMNAQPDRLPVPAANVVGEVVFHSEILGTVASFIRAYWPFLLFLLAVLFVLVKVLERILKIPTKEPVDATD